MIREGVKSDIGIGRQVRLRRDLTSRIHRASDPFGAALWARPQGFRITRPSKLCLPPAFASGALFF